MVYPYDRIIFENKKLKMGTFYEDESWNYYAKWKKSVTKNPNIVQLDLYDIYLEKEIHKDKK